MKYLIVVAHPDDEVLGAGASIWKWAHNGDQVDVCIMCTEAKARAFRPDDKELDDDTHAALKYIGVNKEYEGTFPNIEMNTVPHLQLVQFIEGAIKESEPDIVITNLRRKNRQKKMKNWVVRILDALWQFCSFVFVPQRRPRSEV